MQLGSLSLQQIVMKHRIGPQKVVMDLHQSCNLDIILVNLDQGSGKKQKQSIKRANYFRWFKNWIQIVLKVSFQGVKSLGGHFACLCQGFDFYEVKKNIIIFQKEKGNTFTLLIIFIVKSLEKEQNSTNLLLWPPIWRNKCTITQKWINS